MNAWEHRPHEEAVLLNPAFSATLIWSAARGYESVDPQSSKRALPLELAFLILPIVLHRPTREELPPSVATSLPVWIEAHPLIRARLGERARILVPFTREALLFAGVHHFLSISVEGLSTDERWKATVSRVIQDCTDEVAVCVRRAEFIGRWCARTGDAPTVMALLGVRA
jgi:hypothetical protein